MGALRRVDLCEIVICFTIYLWKSLSAMPLNEGKYYASAGIYTLHSFGGFPP
jgi:hypothetical protein